MVLVMMMLVMVWYDLVWSCGSWFDGLVSCIRISSLSKEQVVFLMVMIFGMVP